jgi:hypothetical protein
MSANRVLHGRMAICIGHFLLPLLPHIVENMTSDRVPLVDYKGEAQNL